MSEGDVTWLGHASALVSLGPDSLLIDPLGRGRTKDLEYRAVLITHAHVDHLNRWTLKQLDKSVDLYVPKGAAAIVADLGFASVVEVEPGDQLQIGALDVACVETRHDAGRWRKGDSPICSGYLIRSGDGPAVYHAGDVDVSDFDFFDEIGRAAPIAAALLPIGGMLPVWYYRMRRGTRDRGVHIDPDTALAIFERLGARAMVPIHWGTVNLRLGGLAGPKKRLLQVAGDAGALPRVSILSHGESLSVSAAAPTTRTEGES